MDVDRKTCSENLSVVTIECLLVNLKALTSLASFDHNCMIEETHPTIGEDSTVL